MTLLNFRCERYRLLAASRIIKPKNNTLQSGWLGSSDRADMHLHLGAVAG